MVTQAPGAGLSSAFGDAQACRVQLTEVWLQMGWQLD